MKGTIKSKEKITKLFVDGSKFSASGFLAFYGETNDSRGMQQQGRAAFAAGKKLGSAPMRNRAKRRLREAARAAGAPWQGYEVVFVAKKGIQKVLFTDMVASIKRLGNLLIQEHENGPTKDKKSAQPTTQDSSLHIEAQKSVKKNRIYTAVVGIPRNIALLCINVYRHAISPLFPPSCRYVPTCSEYAMIAFKRFGFRKGLWLSVRRVGRCHPFVKGGFDPVPEELSNKLA